MGEILQKPKAAFNYKGLVHREKLMLTHSYCFLFKAIKEL